MSRSTTLRGVGRELEDSTGPGQAVDELISMRSVTPRLLALGEPAHGIAGFPLLRNELLGQLITRGYRSIVLETDFFAASVVDDYVNGAASELDTALATGFSHGFGAVPGNRELLEWLRAYNDGRGSQDRVRFYGFDPPVEFSAAPSPRVSLLSAMNQLPEGLRPFSVSELSELIGDDADWSNPAAMYEPAQSIGNSDRARALRIVADDLASAVRRAAPTLAPADPAGYALAIAHARTAQGLLRYHAAMATVSPVRIGTLLSLRAEMMADNLLAIVEQERHRGPSLVFAHNVHLLRGQSRMSVGAEEADWGSAGALVALALGEQYVCVATDAHPRSEPGTFQGLLADATIRRAFFPTPALLAALPAGTVTGEPMVPGHLPLKPEELAGTDAVIFIADTDGKQYRYW